MSEAPSSEIVTDEQIDAALEEVGYGYAFHRGGGPGRLFVLALFQAVENRAARRERERLATVRPNPDDARQVEAVARALYASEYDEPDSVTESEWQSITDAEREFLTSQARAVLTALAKAVGR